MNVAPRMLIEPTSPFVARVDIDQIRPAARTPRAPPLAVTILKDPERVISLVLDEGAADRVVVVALACVAVSVAVFANVANAHLGPIATIQSSALIALNFVLALAAAIGPIYATSVIFAARIPLVRLVAALVCSMAAGAMILAASAPVPWFLFSLDPEWKGPIGVVVSFLVAGVAAGARLKAVLFRLAVRSSDRPLTDDEKSRVGIVCRIALMILGLTVSLTLWGFDALSPVF